MTAAATTMMKWNESELSASGKNLKCLTGCRPIRYGFRWLVRSGIFNWRGIYIWGMVRRHRTYDTYDFTPLHTLSLISLRREDRWPRYTYSHRWQSPIFFYYYYCCCCYCCYKVRWTRLNLYNRYNVYVCIYITLHNSTHHYYYYIYVLYTRIPHSV